MDIYLELKNKVNTEFENYTKEMLSKSTVEIFNHSHDISRMRDIRMMLTDSIECLDLSETDIAELLEEKNILQDISNYYNETDKFDEDYISNVKYAIEKVSSERLYVKKELDYFYFDDIHKIEYRDDGDVGAYCTYYEKMGDKFVVIGEKDTHWANKDTMLNHYGIYKYFRNDKKQLILEINKSLNGELSMYDSIKLCEHTPKILQEIGLEDKPILFTQKHLRDGLHEKGSNPKWHGLTTFDYITLEAFLEKPAMICDSFSDDDSIIVVLGSVDKDSNPIMACIRANGKGQYNLSTIGSNYLTSVYGKDNFENFLQKNIAADFVLFADKKIIHNLECSSKLQLLDNFSNDYEFNEIIHKSNNVVNESINSTADMPSIEEVTGMSMDELIKEDRTVTMAEYGRER